MRTPSHAERARTLAAQTGDGALSTISARHDGAPFGSRALFALLDGDPVFLISTLASHTKNLLADPRASLLVAPASDTPMSDGRVTLVGTAAPTDAPAARDAFLAAHPDAAMYAGFKDFAFWRLSVSDVRYVGGFGRMSWLTPADWRAAEPDPIAPSAAGIISHMNEDHADAMALYCQVLAQRAEVTAATMTAVDRYGFEMSGQTPDGPIRIRLAYPSPVRNSAGVRQALVAMVKEARQGLTNGE